MIGEFIGKESKDKSPSPYGRWLNYTLTHVHLDGLEFTIPVRPEFTNPIGILHGGVIAGIIDELIGVTSFTLGKDGFFVAINLNVDFLRPGNVGEVLTVRTLVVRSGKSMAHVEAKITNAEGKLVAKATSNMALTQR